MRHILWIYSKPDSIGVKLSFIWKFSFTRFYHVNICEQGESDSTVSSGALEETYWSREQSTTNGMFCESNMEFLLTQKN